MINTKKVFSIHFLVLLVLLALGPLSHKAFALALPGRPALSQAGLFEADQYRGKVVYLDFWASWCTPCKQSFPWMRKMHA